MNGKIDVDGGTELAVNFAREHITDQAKKIAFESGLSGEEFDEAVDSKVAASQPYLQRFSHTIRDWLAAGGCGRLSFNPDGTAKN